MFNLFLLETANHRFDRSSFAVTSTSFFNFEEITFNFESRGLSLRDWSRHQMMMIITNKLDKTFPAYCTSLAQWIKLFSVLIFGRYIIFEPHACLQSSYHHSRNCVVVSPLLHFGFIFGLCSFNAEEFKGAVRAVLDLWVFKGNELQSLRVLEDFLFFVWSASQLKQ